MKEVPAVFLGDDGTVTSGHHVVCLVCNHDQFQINVVYLSNGKHTHLLCTRCKNCFCDGLCSEGRPLAPSMENGVN